MSNKKSKIWSFALPLSVVFLGAAYYIKVPEVRKAVDARTPLVRQYLGRFVTEPRKVVVLPGEQDPLFARSAPKEPAPREYIAERPAPPVPSAAPQPAPAAEPPPPVAPPTSNLAQIASDRSRWPKKVVLTKAATFPAVLNGKIVGSLVAPAGAEANVVSIKDDKVGLEFNGGGAWLPIAETDLIARVQPSR